MPRIAHSLEAVRFPALRRGPSRAALALPLAHSTLTVVAADELPALTLQRQGSSIMARRGAVNCTAESGTTG